MPQIKYHEINSYHKKNRACQRRPSMADSEKKNYFHHYKLNRMIYDGAGNFTVIFSSIMSLPVSNLRVLWITKRRHLWRCPWGHVSLGAATRPVASLWYWNNQIHTPTLDWKCYFWPLWYHLEASYLIFYCWFIYLLQKLYFSRPGNDGAINSHPP